MTSEIRSSRRLSKQSIELPKHVHRTEENQVDHHEERIITQEPCWPVGGDIGFPHPILQPQNFEYVYDENKDGTLL